MVFGRGLRALSIASVVLLTGAFALVFFYAPNDADQGFVQKIFYLHVPLAIVALCGFVAGGIYGHALPAHRATARTTCAPTSRSTSRSSSPSAALVTGSIWAKASWGALVGVGRADARLLPDRLPALRLLPAAALLDRGPRAPGPLRGGLRDRRGRVRPAELHGGAHGRGAHPPARARARRAADAGRDAADLPPLAGRDGPACS